MMDTPIKFFLMILFTLSSLDDKIFIYMKNMKFVWFGMKDIGLIYL